MIRVLIKRPDGLEPEVKEIDTGLKSLYKELDCNMIEVIPFREIPGVWVVLDEEGKITGKDPCIMYHGDLLVGDVMFVDGSGEDFGSLDDQQLRALQMMLEGGEE